MLRFLIKVYLKNDRGSIVLPSKRVVWKRILVLCDVWCGLMLPAKPRHILPFLNDLPILENDLGLYVAVRTRRVLQYCTAAHSTTQAKGLMNLAWHSLPSSVLQSPWQSREQNKIQYVTCNVKAPCALCLMTHHPMICFQRYSNATWGKPLVKVSPGCLTVLIFSSWIQLLWFFLQKQIALMAKYLLQGVNWGGKVFANTNTPKLSSWTESFIVVSPIGRFTELVSNSTIPMIGNRFLKHPNNAMILASIVERAVLPCSCDFQRIGTSANVITGVFFSWSPTLFYIKYRFFPLFLLGTLPS